MDNSKFKSLLYEGESDSLDYKREQYPFSQADERQKSELLKDILAFANSWRRTEAYILIGVEESKNGKAKVKGISDHLPEASIQQFVNNKLNKPLNFSYNVFHYGNFEVGVIKVPVQSRPFYLKTVYGKLKKETVYLRRGSSTTIANPDEIKQMGVSEVEANEIPLAELDFRNQRGVWPVRRD